MPKSRARFAGAVLLLSLVLPTFAFAQPTSITERRTADKFQFESCYQSEFGSEEEAENCTTWFAESACSGTFWDNRGDVESFTARENLIEYLKNAEKRVNTMKKCDPMGKKRLTMSLIKRDTDADEATQRERWHRVLHGMDKLLAEPRRDICETIAEDMLFETLIHDPGSRKILLTCLKEPDMTQPNQANMIARFYSADPTSLNDDALAGLIMKDLMEQRFETALAHLDQLQLANLSAPTRDALILRITPLTKILFKNATLDQALPWRPGFEQAKTPARHNRLVLIDALIKAPKAHVAWLAEVEATYRLPYAEYDQIARRAAEILAMPPRNQETTNYIKSLIEHAAAHHHPLLLKALIQHLAQLDENLREPITRTIGEPLANAFIANVRNEIADATNPGNAKNIDANAIDTLQSLLSITSRDAHIQTQLILGECLARTGKTNDALKLLYEVTQANLPDAAQEAWFIAIQTLIKTKKANEAASQREQFEARYPGSPWLRAL